MCQGSQEAVSEGPGCFEASVTWLPPQGQHGLGLAGGIPAALVLASPQAS